MKRLLSYGESNFAEIRKEKRYYVDKTVPPMRLLHNSVLSEI